MTTNPRPCERKCRTCGQSKHHSRFRTYGNNPSRKIGRNEVISTISFSPDCRDCEQRKRNEKKNEDRPLAIIQQRARTAAQKCGESFTFVWEQMNYRGLVQELRAMLSPGAVCLCCGHAPTNESDIHIEHLEPPRHEKDWARLHARNLRLTCASCNRTKGHKPYAQWLDEQEGARLSNLDQPTSVEEPPEAQISLFEGLEAANENNLP